MVRIVNPNDQQPSHGKKEKQQNTKQTPYKTVRSPRSRNQTLVDMGIIKAQNVLSATKSLLTELYPLRKTNLQGQYEIDHQPGRVSAILKLTQTVMQTNEMSMSWSKALWDISQQENLIPKGCYMTFVRSFERWDNVQFDRRMTRQRRLGVLSGEGRRNVGNQVVANNHREGMIQAVKQGDSAVRFGAEVLVSAPDEPTLEIAVNAIQNYLKTNDETRGLHYELDINHQSRPYILYGPNDVAHKDIYVNMTNVDAAISALFVDSGGDRTPGSEYVGVSVGKMIRSHAAYNFHKERSLFVGNEATKQTQFIAGLVDEPSQTYLSKVSSRSYLLRGHSVTHFVMDHARTAEDLMNFPIDDDRKRQADVSKGLLNLLEVVDPHAIRDERLISRFATHINNIILLLGQFRSDNHQNVTDEFADLARDILIDFFVNNKYWAYDARHNLESVRLIGVNHNQFKKLSDFGQYVEQRNRSNDDPRLANALSELNKIINRNILPTIPALDTRTDGLIDELVTVPYRVVDMTGMGVGSTSTASNPAMNVMMMSYLNLLLPTMKNGDVIVFHGMSRVGDLATTLLEMVETSGLNLDLVFTEANQKATTRLINKTSDLIEEEDPETHAIRQVRRPLSLDLVMVDLYQNRIERLIHDFDMDSDFVDHMRDVGGAFFVKTPNANDYIYLDQIL